MKQSAPNLQEDFSKAIDQALLTVHAIEQASVDYMLNNQDVLACLLDEKLRAAGWIVQDANFKDPTFGQLAFEEYSSLVDMVSGSLGHGNPYFAAVSRLHTDRVNRLGNLPVGIYKERRSHKMGMDICQA